MTNEGSEEPKATRESSGNASGEAASSEPRSGSNKSSGERSDPRDSEDEAKRSPRKREYRGTLSVPRTMRAGQRPASRRGANATRERDREGSEEPKATREPSRKSQLRTDGGDEIPLQIAGHEDRKSPGDRDDVFAFEESDIDEESDAADSSGTEDDDEAVEPVELLVQLAKNGEIDPWDIDVVRVTDKFLEALDEADLRTSGRALFYASVLVRMKSDELFAPDAPEEEELPPWEAPFADDGAMAVEAAEGGGFDPIEQLEAEMERRLERKHARGKPETLDELVRELRDAERGTWWKESRSYDTSASPKGWGRGTQELQYHAADDHRIGDEPTADDVTHTTHEEDIEDVIDDVETALRPHYENGREEVLYAEISETGGSRVLTYLALLFLAHRGHVRLEQDELFGDLWVRQVPVDAESEAAIAD